VKNLIKEKLNNFTKKEDDEPMLCAIFKLDSLSYQAEMDPLGHSMVMEYKHILFI
jgi:hypothetical protein